VATAEGQLTVGRKLEGNAVSLRTETAYKADEPGKVAQHTEAQGSSSEVNAEVVQLQFAFLSGETPEAQADRGVSRGHSTPQAAAVEQPEQELVADGGAKLAQELGLAGLPVRF